MNIIQGAILHVIYTPILLVIYVALYCNLRGIEVADISVEEMSVIFVIAFITPFLLRPLKYSRNRRKLGSIINNSPSYIFAVLSYIASTLFRVFGVLLSRVSSFLAWRSISSEEISQGSLILNKSRLKDLIHEYNSSIALGDGKLRPEKIFEAFRNEELVLEFDSFLKKYCADFVEEVCVNRLRLSNENCKLFFKLISSKYSLSQKDIATLGLYLSSEIYYRYLTDQLIEGDFKSPSDVIRAVVIQDIKSSRGKNLFFLKRLIKEKGFSLNSPNYLNQAYEEIREKVKLEYFESNLTLSTGKQDKIEDIIRSNEIIRKLTFLGVVPDDVKNINDTYLIVGSDHSRDSRIDVFYKKKFDRLLSHAFEGHCCKCGKGMGQLEFDHFWFPKSKGGNFLMRNKKERVYINNCVPLCRTCNAQKGNRDFTLFFSEKDLGKIFSINYRITREINIEMTSFKDSDFPGRLF